MKGHVEFYTLRQAQRRLSRLPGSYRDVILHLIRCSVPTTGVRNADSGAPREQITVGYLRRGTWCDHDSNRIFAEMRLPDHYGTAAAWYGDIRIDRNAFNQAISGEMGLHVATRSTPSSVLPRPGGKGAAQTRGGPPESAVDGAPDLSALVSLSQVAERWRMAASGSDALYRDIVQYLVDGPQGVLSGAFHLRCRALPRDAHGEKIPAGDWPRERRLAEVFLPKSGAYERVQLDELEKLGGKNDEQQRMAIARMVYVSMRGLLHWARLPDVRQWIESCALPPVPFIAPREEGEPGGSKEQGVAADYITATAEGEGEIDSPPRRSLPDARIRELLEPGFLAAKEKDQSAPSEKSDMRLVAVWEANNDGDTKTTRTAVRRIRRLLSTELMVPISRGRLRRQKPTH